jgi:hypothetical protein
MRCVVSGFVSLVPSLGGETVRQDSQLIDNASIILSHWPETKRPLT